LKILDKYLLRAFLNTFGTVFVILFFIFILQTVWVFIAELAGKDLDFATIIKFILYYCPIMIPLVLPLSILLASIMTFGSLAENYEFAAMKSGGMSLKRVMKPIFFCCCIIAVVSFLFANNVIPEAQYRFINLRKNIIQTKPAMVIGEGQFNKIGNTINIKVDKKSGENGEILSDIIMHMKANEYSSVNTVIKAKKGLLKSTVGSNLLQLDLLDGYYYEDINTIKYEEKLKLPFAKSTFKKYTINIDLAKMNGTDQSGEIVNAHNMLNMSELKYTIDSLSKNLNKDVISYSDNLANNQTRLYPIPTDKKRLTSVTENTDAIKLFSKLKQNEVKELAKSTIQNNLTTLDGYKFDVEAKQNFINDYWISFYDKILIAYSCLLMFFLGAPLGAIIRKGGVGLPLVFAVLIFIVYNFANTFGKKLAGQDAIHPFIGTAIGALILTPFAILFTKRALEDQGISVSFDWLINPIKSLFNKRKKTAKISNESI
jgi:lipopolysaccharide export system permease protein